MFKTLQLKKASRLFARSCKDGIKEQTRFLIIAMTSSRNGWWFDFYRNFKQKKLPICLKLKSKKYFQFFYFAIK